MSLPVPPGNMWQTPILGNCSECKQDFPHHWQMSRTNGFASCACISDYRISAITSPNYVDSKQKSYGITKMKILVTQYKTRPTKTEVNLTTFQATKLPLQHKADTACCTKPELTVSGLVLHIYIYI
jgi:hypothetical protein